MITGLIANILRGIQGSRVQKEGLDHRDPRWRTSVLSAKPSEVAALICIHVLPFHNAICGGTHTLDVC